MKTEDFKDISSIAEDVYALIKVVDDSCRYNELFNLSAVLKLASEKQLDIIERLSQHW